MAHFAQLDENNIVIRVTVISNDDIRDENGNESEQLGVALCEQLVSPGRWIQTSYNSNFRKQYAGIGFRYDADADVFIEPSPYPSWILNGQHDWEAPIPLPIEGGKYQWNEEAQTWDEMTAEDPGV